MIFDTLKLFDMSRPATDLLLVNERIMAIDFGAKGGFAYNTVMGINAGIYLHDMPGHLNDVVTLIDCFQPDFVYGENVHAFPGQGVVSVATFMKGLGQVQGICAALNRELRLIQPEAWIKWYDIGKRSQFKTTDQWKKHLMGCAQQLFPNLNVTQKTADALLIWNYVARSDFVYEPPLS